MKRIFISTGEVSGDLQGALLISALLRRAALQGKALEIVALGGDRMEKAGATLIGNTTPIGSMGLLESLPFILPTLRIQQRTQRYLQRNPPDVTVLIDYMTPNMVIGRNLRQAYPDRPVLYYIAPQAWVWQENPSVTQRILSACDRILAVFPAEARYYQQAGATVQWVGHPLLDRYPQPLDRHTLRQQLGLDAHQRIITLLPASRSQELKYVLCPMFAAAQQLQAQDPQLIFWIPLSQPQFRPAIEAAIQRYQLKNTKFVASQDLTHLAASDLALTKSGTVNLELALMGVPQVVLYALNPLTAWVLRKLLKFQIPFASPVNLMLMEEIVPELLQEAANPQQIVQATIALLHDPVTRSQLQHNYTRLREQLGEPGVCDRVADAILEYL